MSVSSDQKLDLLYKAAFGLTKTDNSTNKSPSNESIASPALLRADTIWAESSSIPATAAATSGIVTAYTGAGAVQCVADNTSVPIGGVYPTWKTSLTNWIPAEFGSTYVVKVYVDSPGVANPTLTGTQIFAAGGGSPVTGEYYFNYTSGVLNFIGETIPSALTSSKVIYIVGYRYIGDIGLTSGGGGANNTESYDFSSSLTWTVTHNRNTTKFIESIYDTDGTRVYAGVEIVDSNSFTVNFTEPVSGSINLVFI
jgi:hypothetical protein